MARFEEAYTALLFFRPPFSHRFEPPGHKPSDANYREHTRILLHAMLLVGRQATVRFGKRMRLFSLRCLIRNRLQPRAYDSKTGSTQSRFECVTRCLANPALSLSTRDGVTRYGADEQVPVWTSSGRKAPGLGKVPCSTSLMSTGKEGNSAAMGIDAASSTDDAARPPNTLPYRIPQPV